MGGGRGNEGYFDMGHAECKWEDFEKTRNASLLFERLWCGVFSTNPFCVLYFMNRFLVIGD